MLIFFCYRETSWRKSQQELLTACPISENYIFRTTFSAMRAWTMRLSGGQKSSLMKFINKQISTSCHCQLCKSKLSFQGQILYKDNIISFLFFASSQLSSLECLDLSNNNLSVVPKGLPRSLVLLHLEKNDIRSIPGDALTSARNLEYLLLHNNKLRSRSIHPAAFQVNMDDINDPI